MPVKAVVFDVGNVLYHWSPRALYKRLIPDGQALDAFLADVITTRWHFQHDAGRPFAETSAELIAQFPQHEALILAWADRFLETLEQPVESMAPLVARLDSAGLPIFGITNFSHEFWQPFRAQEAHLFDQFQDIIVSGTEKLIKPDPAIFKLALQRFDLAENEAIFIDDVAENVASAAANGFIGHHFSDAGTLEAELVRCGLLA